MIDRLVELARGVVVVDLGTPEKPKIVVVPVTAATQLAAASAVLDRGYGRPHQSVETTGKDSGPIQTGKLSAYDIIVSRIESMAQRPQEDGDG